MEQDAKKAFQWLTKAAEQGFAISQYSLGTMYENGHGVKQDKEKAFQWVEKAAEQGLSVVPGDRARGGAGGIVSGVCAEGSGPGNGIE